MSILQKFAVPSFGFSFQDEDVTDTEQKTSSVPSESQSPVEEEESEPVPKKWWHMRITRNANPGRFDDLTKEHMNVFPRPEYGETFEGFKFLFQRGFSEQYQVHHFFSMTQPSEPTQPSSSYWFQAIYNPRHALSMLGKIDTDLDLTARLAVMIPGTNLKIQTTAELTQEFRKCTFDLDMAYKGSDYTVDLKWQKSAQMSIFAMGYSQAITRHFAAGVSGQFVSFGPRYVPLYHAILKYTSIPMKPKEKKKRTQQQAPKPKPLGYFFTASFMTLPSIEFAYARKVSKAFSLATSLSFAKEPQSQEGKWASQWSLGYSLQSETTSWVKGRLINLTELAIALNERMNEVMSLQLSGQIDYTQQQHKFGIGVTIQI